MKFLITLFTTVTCLSSAYAVTPKMPSVATDVVKSKMYLVPVTTISNVELVNNPETELPTVKFDWDGQDCVTYVGLRLLDNNDIMEFEAMTQYDASTYNCLADGTKGTVEQVIGSMQFRLGGQNYEVVYDGATKKLVKLKN